MRNNIFPSLEHRTACVGVMHRVGSVSQSEEERAGGIIEDEEESPVRRRMVERGLNVSHARSFE